MEIVDQDELLWSQYTSILNDISNDVTRLKSKIDVPYVLHSQTTDRRIIITTDEIVTKSWGHTMDKIREQFDDMSLSSLIGLVIICISLASGRTLNVLSQKNIRYTYKILTQLRTSTLTYTDSLTWLNLLINEEKLDVFILTKTFVVSHATLDIDKQIILIYNIISRIEQQKRQVGFDDNDVGLYKSSSNLSTYGPYDSFLENRQYGLPTYKSFDQIIHNPPPSPYVSPIGDGEDKIIYIHDKPNDCSEISNRIVACSDDIAKLTIELNDLHDKEFKQNLIIAEDMRKLNSHQENEKRLGNEMTSLRISNAELLKSKKLSNDMLSAYEQTKKDIESKYVNQIDSLNKLITTQQDVHTQQLEAKEANEKANGQTISNLRQQLQDQIDRFDKEQQNHMKDKAALNAKHNDLEKKLNSQNDALTKRNVELTNHYNDLKIQYDKCSDSASKITDAEGDLIKALEAEREQNKKLIEQISLLEESYKREVARCKAEKLQTEKVISDLTETCKIDKNERQYEVDKVKNEYLVIKESLRVSKENHARDKKIIEDNLTESNIQKSDYEQQIEVLLNDLKQCMTESKSKKTTDAILDVREKLLNEQEQNLHVARAKFDSEKSTFDAFKQGETARLQEILEEARLTNEKALQLKRDAEDIKGVNIIKQSSLNERYDNIKEKEEANAKEAYALEKQMSKLTIREKKIEESKSAISELIKLNEELKVALEKQKTDLDIKVNENKKKIDKLDAERQAFENDKESQSAFFSKLSISLDERERAVTLREENIQGSFDDAKKTLTKQKKDLDDQFAQLEDAIKEFDSVKNKLESRNREDEKQLGDFSKIVKSLEEENNALKKQLSEAPKDVVVTTADKVIEVKTLKRQIKALQEKNKVYTEAIKNLKNGYDREDVTKETIKEIIFDLP